MDSHLGLTYTLAVTTWSIYLIRCRSGALYTGIATDVPRRFQEHCAGAPKGAKYLRGKGPLTLVFEKVVGSRSLAAKVERRVKQLKKREKEALIRHRGDLDAIIRSVDVVLPRAADDAKR